MTKCTRVEHPSYHLDELRSIRMNIKSNTGYVPTKPGDLPSEALGFDIRAVVAININPLPNNMAPPTQQL